MKYYYVVYETTYNKELQIFEKVEVFTCMTKRTLYNYLDKMYNYEYNDGHYYSANGYRVEFSKFSR